MKRIQIDNMQRELRFPRELSGAMRKACLIALEKAGMPEDTELSISIISEKRMRGLNNAERGIDAVTDVLSFPFIDWGMGKAGDFESVRAQAERNPETGRIMLGAVVICIGRAAEQAEDYGHSLKREMAFLATHGTLHLCGFDHMEESDEKTMTALSERVLSEAGIPRLLL